MVADNLIGLLNSKAKEIGRTARGAEARKLTAGKDRPVQDLRARVCYRAQMPPKRGPGWTACPHLGLGSVRPRSGSRLASPTLRLGS